MPKNLLLHLPQSVIESRIYWHSNELVSETTYLKEKKDGQSCRVMIVSYNIVQRGMCKKGIPTLPQKG
jgi:hypothetical protein